MKIVVVDGQGGGIGKNLVERLKVQMPDSEIIAVGTNSIATAAMLRAGANAGATGENAVVCCCREADVIAGPIGILISNSMLGEITRTMAAAVAESHAQKVLIPVSRCHVLVAGTQDKLMSRYIEDAVALIEAL